MEKTWVVVADASRARIFELPPEGPDMPEIVDLVNPSGRAQARELQSDANGRFYAKGGAGAGGHTAGPKKDPTEHDTELFAKHIGEFLDKSRSQLRYERLILIAPPKFLGLLREKLTGPTHKLVTREIHKDLSQLDARTIREHLERQRV
jgi:protein required for attachment to host cells